jgi:hypothetical protein
MWCVVILRTMATRTRHAEFGDQAKAGELNIGESGAPSALRTRVALVGHICIDRNVIDGAVQAPSWGSPALFAQQYLSEMPFVTSDVIGSYGRDFAEHWPDIAICNPPTAGQTLNYKNITEGMKTTRQSSHTEDAQPIRIEGDLVGIVSAADLVMVTPVLPNFSAAYVSEVKAAARPSATFVLLAQGYLRSVDDAGIVNRRRFEEAHDVLPQFDVVIVADDDIASTWTEAAHQAQQWSTAHPSVKIIVTRNKLGAAKWDNGRRNDFPARSLARGTDNNSVGAGDTFGAAVALAYSITEDIDRAVRAGNEAAWYFLSSTNSGASARETHSGVRVDAA